MTSCKECKSAISTSADTCPRCGARQPSAARGRIILFGLLALVAAVVLGRCNRSAPHPAAPQPSVPAASAPEPQAWRTTPETTPSDTNTQTGNCPTELRAALQTFLVREGMTCGSVSFCSTMSAQNIRVTCNSDAYAYRIRDRGAGYYVEFD
jgi:hypothetical protein